MKSIFTEEQIEYMKSNYLTMSYREIAKTLGFTERQIRGKINNMNLSKLRKINSDYFHEINTPLKAYLLGFIYADGWITYNIENRNYEFGMELMEEDKYVLDLINNELGGKNKLVYTPAKKTVVNGVEANRKPTYCLRVYCKELVFDLERHGIEKNKTQKDIYPVVDENLFFDFLRGYIDGDGCFYNGKTNTIMHITCSSDVPLKYIQDKLKQYNIDTTVYMEKERKYRLLCSNLNSISNLVNRLYYKDDLFCLKRKYEKIKTLIIGSAA